MELLPREAVGAAATIVAAIVGGIVALLGLIISKEQKVSEFRQQWIDGLRADTATVIRCGHSLNVNLTGTFLQLSVSDVKATAAEMVEAVALIRLRLNEKETETQSLLRALTLLMAAAKTRNPDDELLNSTIEELVVATKVVLKQEWNVVRSGEPVYRAAKKVAFIVVIASRKIGRAS